jgi:hypothetical protein
MATLIQLFHAIAAGEVADVERMLTNSPSLARDALGEGASRENPTAFFLEGIRAHIYAGHTALHVAASAWNRAVAKQLLSLGASIDARNRRGHQPLHAATGGGPGWSRWDPRAQVAMIRFLLKAGADPNSLDGNGTSPFHRAIRNRSSAAVQALLDGGADPKKKNKKGSTPLALARWNTGRSGTGSPEAKAEQAEILKILKRS